MSCYRHCLPSLPLISLVRLGTTSSQDTAFWLLPSCSLSCLHSVLGIFRPWFSRWKLLPLPLTLRLWVTWGHESWSSQSQSWCLSSGIQLQGPTLHRDAKWSVKCLLWERVRVMDFGKWQRECVTLEGGVHVSGAERFSFRKVDGDWMEWAFGFSNQAKSPLGTRGDDQRAHGHQITVACCLSLLNIHDRRAWMPLSHSTSL